MGGSVSTLSDLQRRFTEQVLHGGGGVHEAVVSDARADAATRVGIYADGYRLRLLEVLGNDFGGLRHLAGPDGFDALGRAYIDARPSPHYNARWYGDALSSFLSRTSPWSARPELGEMAGLEWDMTIAFDAADVPTAAFADIVALSPEQWPSMWLRLQPGFGHRRLRFNVDAIRRALDREESPPDCAPLDAEADWAVWRRDLNVRHRRLEADEAGVIRALQSGLCFGDLCEALCEWHEPVAVAQRAAQLLKGWVDEQWLRAL